MKHCVLCSSYKPIENVSYSCAFIYIFKSYILIENFVYKLVCPIDFIKQLHWICDCPEEKSKYFITNSDPVTVLSHQSMESSEVIELLLGLAYFYRKFRLCSYSHIF